MLVGERINNGFFLYKDIWTNISPFSALIYSFIEANTSRSHAINAYIGIPFTLIVIFVFNNVMIKRNAFLEKNFVPALIFAFFLNLSYDMFSLSPPLLSVLFLILAFNKIVIEMEKSIGVSDEVFEVGLYLGIATLFNLPSFVFIIWAFLSILFFTGSSFRQYFLLFFGFSLPIFLVILFYYLNNSFAQLSYNWLSSFLRVRSIEFNEIFVVLAILLTPGLLAILGFFRVSVMLRYNSYQTRMQQIMMLWVLVGITALFIMPRITPSQIIILMPPIAFFTAHYFLNMKNRFRADLFFTIAVGFMSVLFYLGIIKQKTSENIFMMQSLQIDKSRVKAEYANQKVLIVGDEFSEYLNSTPATCYLNWDLSAIDLNNPDNFVSIINIFDNFKNDSPQFIIDKKNVIPRIFERIPELSRRYTQIEKGVYKKR